MSGRAIPASGPGRRRAKAKRNRGQCVAMLGDMPCWFKAVPGAEHCRVHISGEVLAKLMVKGKLTSTWSRSRGKRYEHDTVRPDTGWTVT